MANKGFSRKDTHDTVFRDALWSVVRGKLTPSPGRPGKVKGLFLVVAEKIPLSALDCIRKDMTAQCLPLTGVYMAHDSMGFARYAGRGNIFSRLKAHKKTHSLELAYFSFYIVLEKIHEREIETILIRAAGPQLQFNDRKKQITIKPGNIRDYEPRTSFYERQYRKGRRS